MPTENREGWGNRPHPSFFCGTIQFALPETGTASLEVYDLQGRMIRRLFSGVAEKGLTKTFLLQAEGLTTGVYFTRPVTGNQVLTQRIVLGN